MDIRKLNMEQLLEHGYITQEQYDQGFVTYNQVIDNINDTYGEFFEQLGVPRPFHIINGDLIGWTNMKGEYTNEQYTL